MSTELNSTPFFDKYELFVTPEAPNILYSCKKGSIREGKEINYTPRFNPVYSTGNYNIIKPKIGQFSAYASYSRKTYKNFYSFKDHPKFSYELHLRAQFSFFSILKKIKDQYDSIDSSWDEHVKFLSFYKPGNIVPRSKRSDAYTYSICKVDKVETIDKDKKYQIHMTAFSDQSFKAINGRPMVYDVTIQGLRPFSSLLNMSQISNFLTWNWSNFKNSILTTYLLFREFSIYNKNNESQNLSE